MHAVQEQANVAACATIQPILEAFLETEGSVKRGREQGEARRSSGRERPMDWQCGHGGCKDAKQLTRDGHDHRGLSSGWGHRSDLRMPMLECQHG